MKKLLISISILVLSGISCNSTLGPKKPRYPQQTKSYMPVEKFIGDMGGYVYVFEVDGHEYISTSPGGLLHKVNCGGKHGS